MPNRWAAVATSDLFGGHRSSMEFVPGSRNFTQQSESVLNRPRIGRTALCFRVLFVVGAVVGVCLVRSSGKVERDGEIRTVVPGYGVIAEPGCEDGELGGFPPSWLHYGDFGSCVAVPVFGQQVVEFCRQRPRGVVGSDSAALCAIGT